MLRRFRLFLCKRFHLVLQEEVPTFPPIPANDWIGLWEVKDFRAVWPRIVKTPLWENDIEPFYKQALLRTLVALAHEKEAEQIVRLQVRAQLINEWLEQPRIALRMDEAALENAFGSGRLERMKERERANVR